MRIGFESSSWTGVWILLCLCPPASSTFTSPTRTSFGLRWTIAQVPARRVVYIENTPLFVQIAEELGIHGICHTDYQSTCAKLASCGLQTDAGVIHETGYPTHPDY
jgi:hypothetical protein